MYDHKCQLLVSNSIHIYFCSNLKLMLVTIRAISNVELITLRITLVHMNYICDFILIKILCKYLNSKNKRKVQTGICRKSSTSSKRQKRKTNKTSQHE